MKVYMAIMLIVLPIALLYRNFRFGCRMIKSEYGKLLNISETFFRLLYPGQKYQAINQLGLIYQFSVVIPSIILLVLTIYLYLILLGFLKWSPYINGQYIISGSLILFIYIGTMDIVFEGVIKVYRSRRK